MEDHSCTPLKVIPVPPLTHPRHRTTTNPSQRLGAKVALTLLAALALAVAGVWLLNHHYNGRALPGTTVAGIDVSGMDQTEARDVLSQRLLTTTVKVQVGAHSEEVHPAELGAETDIVAAADKAVAPIWSPAALWSQLTGGRDIPVETVVNQTVLQQYVDRHILKDKRAATDARAVEKADGRWGLEPSTTGLSANLENVPELLEQQTQTLENSKLDIPLQEVAPEISDDTAQATVNTLEAMRTTPVDLVGPDGEHWEITAKDRKGWFTTTKADGALHVTINEDAVSTSVTDTVADLNVEPEPGIEQVDTEGRTAKVISKSTAGQEVTNTDELTAGLQESLTSQTPYEGTVKAQEVPATPMKVNAPGAEGNPDAGALADKKWIDVNLEDKTVTAYKGNTPVWGPRPIVDGKDGNETVTGSYEIYLRFEQQDMTNGAYYPKGHPKYYYNPDVPWVQYFHRGFGFHGAPWRDSFGYSGSHGCINMPVAEAKWLYNWADMGTRVEVHY